MSDSETRAIYRLADKAFSRWSCPSSGECCGLTKTGLQPWLWPSEWELIASRVGPPRADGGCPFLDAGGRRCTVYADRPLGCRTYFCHRAQGPGQQPYEQMGALSRRLEALNLELDEEARPRPMLEWAAR